MAHTTETFKVDLKAENWWTDKRTSAKGKWGLQVLSFSPLSLLALCYIVECNSAVTENHLD